MGNLSKLNPVKGVRASVWSRIFLPVTFSALCLGTALTGVSLLKTDGKRKRVSWCVMKDHLSHTPADRVISKTDVHKEMLGFKAGFGMCVLARNICIRFLL